MDSTSIVLLQRGVVLSPVNQLMAVHKDSFGINLLQLGVVLSAGNQLISQLFIRTHLALYCSSLALSCLLAIS